MAWVRPKPQRLSAPLNRAPNCLHAFCAGPSPMRKSNMRYQSAGSPQRAPLRYVVCVGLLVVCRSSLFAADAPLPDFVNWGYDGAWQRDNGLRSEIILNGWWRWQPVDRPELELPKGPSVHQLMETGDEDEEEVEEDEEPKEKPRDAGPPTEGWLRLSQYLVGFSDFAERVPMVMGVAEESFVFVNARKGWDLDFEALDVVCVVPRTGLEQVVLYREAAAYEMGCVLGLGKGLYRLLSDPMHGLVLLQLDLVDADGKHQQPVFLLDTGEMMPDEDEQMVAFLRMKSQEPRPDAYLVESFQFERN